MFNSVASKYDIMKDVMSVGIHRIWKEGMMDWLAPRAGQRLLDVAGGTGDIAFRFLKRAGYGHATVLDLTEPMLVEGRKRAEAEQMQDSLDWVWAMRWRCRSRPTALTFTQSALASAM